MFIDSHQHFWKYNDNDYGWISDANSAIKRDFLPSDLAGSLKTTGVDGSIAVHARQSLQETTWLLELARKNASILGVVGWLPLCSPDIAGEFEHFSGQPKLVGARHVVHDEPDDDFILRDDFNEGVRHIGRHGLVYDILIFAKHLPNTIIFIDRHPEMQFVVDHIAKPTIIEGKFDEEWRKNMLELGRRPNVACKVSGMTAEVHGESWCVPLFQPYFDTVLEAFGPQRLMFGSDWPVCLLMTEYVRWFKSVNAMIRTLSADEQSAILGVNAQQIYSLDGAGGGSSLYEEWTVAQ